VRCATRLFFVPFSRLIDAFYPVRLAHRSRAIIVNLISRDKGRSAAADLVGGLKTPQGHRVIHWTAPQGLKDGCFSGGGLIEGVPLKLDGECAITLHFIATNFGGRDSLRLLLH
jgi:hypothetical protein